MLKFKFVGAVRLFLVAVALWFFLAPQTAGFFQTDDVAFWTSNEGKSTAVLAGILWMILAELMGVNEALQRKPND